MKTTLELNHTYLITEDKWTNYPLIYKATVVDVTKTCYQLKRENGNTSWELQEKVASKWKVIEDLGDLITSRTESLRLKLTDLQGIEIDWEIVIPTGWTVEKVMRMIEASKMVPVKAAR